MDHYIDGTFLISDLSTSQVRRPHTKWLTQWSYTSFQHETNKRLATGVVFMNLCVFYLVYQPSSGWLYRYRFKNDSILIYNTY